MRKVVILGGTGVFGKRLARHLVAFENIELIVTSRSENSARVLAAELSTLNPKAVVSGVALNTEFNFQSQLSALQPWAVIDCSGPFQFAGYGTAEVVLRTGSHLIDLADARDYLLGYQAHLDELAKRYDVCGIAGASSTPALTGAVVEALREDLSEVANIDVAIVPGGKSVVGEAVISAVLSYAGKKVPALKNGDPSQRVGWVDGSTINVPRLGSRRVAAVETIDAELLSQCHSVTGRITFSAGLESTIEQRGIELLARLRRAGLFPNPQFLVPLLTQARKLTALFNSDRGGMVVDLEGRDAQGKIVKKRWSLLAENDHGPSVPIMAAAAALRRLLDDRVTPGATIAQLPLDAITDEMAGYAITTQTEYL